MAQDEALLAKFDAQMECFDKLQATLDTISCKFAESNIMKEDLQNGFDNMHTQLNQMKDKLIKTQKNLRKSHREVKENKELYEVKRDVKEVTIQAGTTELIKEMRMVLKRLLTTEEPKIYLLTNALNNLDNS